MSLDLETYMFRASSTYPSSSLSKKKSTLRQYGAFLEKTAALDGGVSG